MCLACCSGSWTRTSDLRGISSIAFYLYCWADALKSRIIFIPKGKEAKGLINLIDEQLANDNFINCRASSDKDIQKPRIGLERFIID